MDMDEEDVESVSEESDDDDENNSLEVKELKARLRYLQSLLPSVEHEPSPPLSLPPCGNECGCPPALCIVPGYTLLIVDTNTLLLSLSVVASLIESLRWTIVVPLLVIMELNDLAMSTTTPFMEQSILFRMIRY